MNLKALSGSPGQQQSKKKTTIYCTTHILKLHESFLIKQPRLALQMCDWWVNAKINYYCFLNNFFRAFHEFISYARAKGLARDYHPHITVAYYLMGFITDWKKITKWKKKRIVLVLIKTVTAPLTVASKMRGNKWRRGRPINTLFTLLNINHP